MNQLGAVFGHNLDCVEWLVDDKTSLQLLDALFDALNAFICCHILLEVLVEHRVDEVSSVPVGTHVYLLEGAKVVKPVEFCLLLDHVIPANEAVNVEGRAGANGSGHFGSHPLGSRLDIGFVACAELHELHVALDEV